MSLKKVPAVGAHPGVVRMEQLSVLGDSSNNSWASLLQPDVVTKKGLFQKGIPFKELLDGVNVLVLGDTNHEFLGVQAGLVNHLGELKKAGVSHLLLEIPKNLEGRPFEEVAERIKFMPHRNQDFLETAASMGLKFKFIDMPDDMRKQLPDRTPPDKARGIFMGREIADFARGNIDKKAVAIVGFGHIMEEDEIPLQLSDLRNPVPHRLVAVVCEGQRAYHPFMSGTPVAFSLPVVAAVRSIAKPGEREGYINLESVGGLIKEPVSGIIHFSVPPLESETIMASMAEGGRMLSGGVQDGLTALVLSSQSRTLVPRQEGMQVPVTVDFQAQIREEEDRLHDKNSELGINVHYWEHLNERFMLQFVDQVGNRNNLSVGQKVYLAAMLMSYGANNFRHNMNGLLLMAEFVPYREHPRRNAYFGFRSGDTFGYRIPKQVDYGSGLETPCEISLKELEQHFGFQGVILDKAEDLPRVEISPNGEDPVSFLKVGLMVLIASKRPDLVRASDRKIEVLYPGEKQRNPKHPNAKICELDIRDFELSEPEKALVEITDLAGRLGDSMASVSLGLNDQPEFNPTTRLGRLRARLMPSRVLSQYGKFKDLHNQEYRYQRWPKSETLSEIYQTVVPAILDARVELRHMSGEELAEVKRKIDVILSHQSETFAEAERLFEDFPHMKNREDSIHRNVHGFVMESGVTLEKMRASSMRVGRLLTGGELHELPEHGTQKESQ